MLVVVTLPLAVLAVHVTQVHIAQAVTTRFMPGLLLTCACMCFDVIATGLGALPSMPWLVLATLVPP